MNSKNEPTNELIVDLIKLFSEGNHSELKKNSQILTFRRAFTCTSQIHTLTYPKTKLNQIGTSNRFFNFK